MSPLCSVAVAVEAADVTDSKGAACCGFGSAIYQQSSIIHRRAAPRIRSACHICL